MIKENLFSNSKENKYLLKVFNFNTKIKTSELYMTFDSYQNQILKLIKELNKNTEKKFIKEKISTDAIKVLMIEIYEISLDSQENVNSLLDLFRVLYCHQGVKK